MAHREDNELAWEAGCPPKLLSHGLERTQYEPVINPWKNRPSVVSQVSEWQIANENLEQENTLEVTFLSLRWSVQISAHPDCLGNGEEGGCRQPIRDGKVIWGK